MELTTPPYLCGVSPIREVRGLVDLDDAESASLLHCVPWAQAMQTCWPTDAHFVTYHVEAAGEIEAEWPRINKSPAVNQIRMLGGDLKAWALVFDWDTKGKFPDLDPTGEKKFKIDAVLLDRFWETFFAMPESVLHWAENFTYYYTTANGVRLVYVLRRPLPVERSEALHKFLVRQLWEGGLYVDKLSDWTRFFRLPRVMRRDETPAGKGQEYESKPIDEYWQDKSFDPVPVVGEAALTSPPAAVKSLDYPKPTDDDVDMALGREDDRPGWWKDLKRVLRDRHCYTTVYEHRLLAEANRNTTIQQFVGEICQAMFVMRGKGVPFTPTHCYALLHEACLQLEPDEQDPDWTATLWKAVLKYWAKELGKEEVAEVKKQAEVLMGQSLMDRMIGGMRQWCDAPELRADDSSAAQFCSQHLIVGSPASNYYLMGKDGYYDHQSVRDNLLFSRIRELGLESVIPLGYMGDKGAWKKYTRQEVIDRHSTSIVAVEGHAGGNGNWIRNLRGDYPTLCLRLYRRRTDLKATWDPEVDTWIRMLMDSEEEQYHRANAYFGHALAFDEGPIAAAAFTGSRNVGKKMIALGLCECITSEVYADSGDMGKYGPNLMRSPFLIVNEGMKRGKEGYDPADLFRLLTAGDPFKVETKFKDTVEIRAPLRLLILANNFDVVTSLAGRGRNLTIDDKLAMAQRLITFRVRDKAANWLRLKGGLEFTKGWVSRDAGGQSDYRIAKHFLWLYENRPKVEFGARFLMEGSAQEEVMQTLSTRSGNAPMVIECLVAMIEASKSMGVEGVHVQTADEPEIKGMHKEAHLMQCGPLPRVWVTANSVGQWLKRQAERGGHVSQVEVAKVFRGLGKRGEPENGRRLSFETSKGKQTADWFCLDLPTLLNESYSLGYRCTRLQELVLLLESAHEPPIKVTVNDKVS